MNYRTIRDQAFEANIALPKLNLVLFTFGNVSAADHAQGLFAIKPSGMTYELLTPEKMVIVDFEGKFVEGNYRPSSDTPTHALLYQHWRDVGGICHTHSTFATAWAQSRRPIPIYGTTHADHLAAEIPCTPFLTEEQIKGDYELETGHQILNALKNKQTEMILVGGHAPFTWGNNAEKAVYNSAVLENIARMALLTEQLQPKAKTLPEALIQKHYERKHGPDAYYGQLNKK